jgi:predicted regulator of Ras-like GTPase activity (Roadblock/LC7/MglB family)
MPIADMAALAADCQAALGRLADRCPGLKWACVATKDGIEVASLGTAESGEKLSVMVGTMLALADGIVGEAELGACQDIILAAEGGRIVITGVRDPAGELVLPCMAGLQSTLGMLITSSAAICTEIAGLPSLAYRDADLAAE